MLDVSQIWLLIRHYYAIYYERGRYAAIHYYYADMPETYVSAMRADAGLPRFLFIDITLFSLRFHFHYGFAIQIRHIGFSHYYAGSTLMVYAMILAYADIIIIFDTYAAIDDDYFRHIRARSSCRTHFHILMLYGFLLLPQAYTYTPHARARCRAMLILYAAILRHIGGAHIIDFHHFHAIHDIDFHDARCRCARSAYAILFSLDSAWYYI